MGSEESWQLWESEDGDENEWEESFGELVVVCVVCWDSRRKGIRPWQRRWGGGGREAVSDDISTKIFNLLSDQTLPPSPVASSRSPNRGGESVRNLFPIAPTLPIFTVPPPPHTPLLLSPFQKNFLYQNPLFGFGFSSWFWLWLG